MDQALSEAGHILTKIGTQKQQCSLCKQSWPLKTRAAVIALGHCPGPGLWGPETSNPHLPRRAPRGSQIVINGHGLDTSHNLAWHRGITFCWRCGAYTTGVRVVQLIHPCPPGPSSKKKRALDAIREGKSPLDSGEWPLPEDAYPPDQFIGYHQRQLDGPQDPDPMGRAQ